jgi:hypothetical protein
MSSRHTASDRRLKASEAGAVPNVHAVLAELLGLDGAKILSKRVRNDVGGLASMLEQFGDHAVQAAKTALIKGMIDAVPVGHIKSWRYFEKAAAEEQRLATLCVECKKLPRAADGMLSRCTDCIKVAAQRDREEREARKAAYAERMAANPPTSKTCKTCKKSKAVGDFSKHRLARDGLRKSCKACVRRESSRRKEKTKKAVIVDKARRAQPHRRMANRQAVRSRTARNPLAVRARQKLRQAVRRGTIIPADVCEAEGCASTRHIQGHHANYRQWNEVAWLCGRCHRRAHANRKPVALKASAMLRRATIPRLN